MLVRIGSSKGLRRIEMNVLILSGRFGMGHLKCAEAIKEEILAKNPDTEVSIVDMMDYLYPHLSGFVYKSFNLLVDKCSGLYNLLNVMAGKKDCTPFKEVCKIRVEQLMADYKPDLVIANLPISAQYFGYYKETVGIDVPLYVYVTDVTFHNEWIAPGVDQYFVGAGVTRDALLERGISPEMVHVAGIPVSRKFETERCADSNKVLVMGGGLGLIPGGMKTLEILNTIPDLEVTLVCGKNEKLKSEATARFENIRVIGFTEEIAELMKDASVIITKPGGITTFEAIKSETPLYIVAPTLQQELGNAEYIEKHGIGQIVYSMDEFTEENLRDFMLDKTLINNMKNNMARLTYRMESSNPLDYMVVA